MHEKYTKNAIIGRESVEIRGNFQIIEVQEDDMSSSSDEHMMYAE